MKRLIIFLFGMFLFIPVFGETETTQWYIDGELYATTTCESGGDITMPTLPERFGYNFDGWMPAIYDISTLDASINGSTVSSGGTKWNVTFSYGTLYGEILCSNKADYDVDQPGTQRSGNNVWCRITHFQPTGSDIIYEPVPSKWVYYGTSSYCSYNNIGEMCASPIKTNTTYRQKLFN